MRHRIPSMLVLLIICLTLVVVGAGGSRLDPTVVLADACSHADQGSSNIASGSCATVSGGESNSADGNYAFIGGGSQNHAVGPFSEVAGGDQNSAYSQSGSVGGGYFNLVTDDYGSIGGGAQNEAGNGTTSVTDSQYATVAGGFHNKANSAYSIIAGGSTNSVNGFVATVGGGLRNLANGARASIAGGSDNAASGGNSFIGGGGANQTSGLVATIAGGESNRAAGSHATISGGYTSSASGNYTSIAGGRSNIASADYGSVGGGYTNQATGLYATVPGGYMNAATSNTAFAAGRQAKANHQGTFVWGDYQAADIASTAANQFIVRAGGGIWLGTTSAPSIPAGRFIQTSTGAYLSSGGTWTNSSDKNLKTNIAAINPQVILAKVANMPIAAWNYKAEAASIKHIGPMAQDFAAAFGLGEDDKHIATVDADGVALAAVQGLNQENQTLKQTVASLQARVTAMEHAPRTAGTSSAGATLNWTLIVLVLGSLALVLLAGLALVWMRINRRPLAT